MRLEGLHLGSRLWSSAGQVRSFLTPFRLALKLCECGDLEMSARWSPADNERLEEQFVTGSSLAGIAASHNCTAYEVLSRLHLLGLIEERTVAAFNSEQIGHIRGGVDSFLGDGRVEDYETSDVDVDVDDSDALGDDTDEEESGYNDSDDDDDEDESCESNVEERGDYTLHLSMKKKFRTKLEAACKVGELPDWTKRWGRFEEHGSVTSVLGLIVHRPSKSVVGCLDGYRIRRDAYSPAAECDEVSEELLDMCSTLFAPDGRRLRPALEGNFWGSSLDGGRIVCIEKMELDVAHRGKGMLTSILPDLQRFARTWQITAYVTLPGCVHQRQHPNSRKDTDVSSTPSGPNHDARGSTSKLMNAFSTIGFRRLGRTKWMAMIPLDNTHPCWDPATFEPYDYRFPFSKVQGILRTQGLRYCISVLTKHHVERAARGQPQFPVKVMMIDYKKAMDMLFAATDGAAFVEPLPGLTPEEKTLIGDEKEPTEVRGTPLAICKEILQKTEGQWKGSERFAPTLKSLLNALYVESGECTPDESRTFCSNVYGARHTVPDLKDIVRMLLGNE